MRKLCDGVVCPGTGRRLHQRFGPLCTAAWAEQDGPAASRHRSDAPLVDWFSGNRSPPVPLTRRRLVRRARVWTAGSSDPHSRRARPLRSCPRPDGAAYKSRTESLWPGVAYGQPRPTSRVCRAGERKRPPQARATRTRNPWHRAPETVSSHGRELSRLPASLPPRAERTGNKKARNQVQRSS